jgi:hypothetical protein
VDPPAPAGRSTSSSGERVGAHHADDVRR